MAEIVDKWSFSRLSRYAITNFTEIMQVKSYEYEFMTEVSLCSKTDRQLTLVGQLRPSKTLRI